MLPRLRAAVFVLLTIPLLATCGEGAGPTAPIPSVPEKLGIVTAPPSSVANGQTFGAVIQLRTNAGAPVSEAGVVVHVAVTEAGTPLAGAVDVVTGEDGQAVFTGLSMTGLVGARHLTFSSAGLASVGATLTLGAGAPATLVRISGDSQVSTAGLTTPAPLVALVRDGAGNPVPGATVRAQIQGGGGTVGGAGSVDQPTGSDGKVTVGTWTLGWALGTNALRLSLPGYSAAGTLDFTAQGTVGPPANVEMVSTWPYSSSIDTLFTTPLIATVTDIVGHPVGARRVQFHSNDSLVVDADTLTDSLGRATLHSLRAPTTPGAWSIQLKIPGTYVSGGIGLNLQAGPPVRIEHASDSLAFLPTSAFVDLRARVFDGYGNAAGNKYVQWSIASGPGTLGPINPVTEGGVSHAEFHPAGAGRTVVQAWATLLPDSVVTFTVDVVAPVALIAVAGDSQRVTAGDTISAPLRVRVIDEAGAGVRGVPVHFDDRPLGETQVTDSAGYLDAPPIVARAQVEAYILRASTAWVADSSAQWTVLPHAGPAVELVRLLEDVNETPSGVVGMVIAQPPGVKLRDRLGLPVMAGVVHFTPQHGSVSVDTAVVDSITGLAYPVGWTLDTIAGEQTLTATMGALTPLQLYANATSDGVASLTALPGPPVMGFVGEPVAYGLRVEARDRFGNRAVGKGWQALGVSGGTTNGESGTFDEAGRAYVFGWTLGSVGSANGVRVAAGSAILDTIAEGVAPSPFHIAFRGVPETYHPVFQQASFQWRRRITADVPDITVDIPGGLCASFQGGLNGTVDDLVIDVSIGTIDGPGGILGGATPCFIRTASQIPLLGAMQFDIADLGELEQEGTIGDVILHEMGHVLGIGSLWSTRGLVTNPGTLNPQYTGPGGMAGWAEIGGVPLGVTTVPVEGTGGPGTANVHWRETVMPSELMTGYLSAAVNPLSAVTLRSLQDLGYTVDTTMADPYTVMTAPSPVPGRPPVRIQDRVGRPIFTVDPNGRVRPIE